MMRGNKSGHTNLTGLLLWVIQAAALFLQSLHSCTEPACASLDLTSGLIFILEGGAKGNCDGATQQYVQTVVRRSKRKQKAAVLHLLSDHRSYVSSSSLSLLSS